MVVSLRIKFCLKGSLQTSFISASSFLYACLLCPACRNDVNLAFSEHLLWFTLFWANCF